MTDQPVGQHAAVKRARSNSVESASSSASNKRNSPSVALAAMDLSNDAATSASASAVGGGSSDSSGSSSSDATQPLLSLSSDGEVGQSPTADLVDGKVQLDMVLPTLQQPLSEGDKWFIVDRNWFRKWQAACGGAVDDKGLAEITMQEVGPIDNSRIANPRNGKLTTTVAENENVVFLPGMAWHLLEKWYGRTGVPVAREVFQARDGASLDLYPPEISISRVVPSSSPQQPSQAIMIQAASGWTISKLKGEIARALNVNASNPSRLWHLNEGFTEGTIKPEDVASAQAQFDTAADTDILRASTIGSGARLAFEQSNDDGTWIVPNGSSAAPAATAPTPTPLFGNKGHFELMQEKHDEFSRKRAELTSVPLTTTRSRDSEASTSARNSRRGLVGLQNLGNTCFMNSALQCLSNTPSLQQYFFTGFYKRELNPSNPLGMGGEVAKAFGTLMERMWSGSNSSVTPREFKQTLSKFAPAFSGWQQHDSQELLAFLLDGLHEDLNRIVKKPYDEIPDWEGGGDKEELELANKSWDLYKRRNDSVIVDLFQGQYRSRLTCPECQKVAIKFDPFMYLSLAIPQDKKWEGDVYLVPADPKKPHIRATLEVPFNATFRALKQALGELTGYDHKKLFCAEEFGHKFYKIWPDTDSVSQLLSNDVLVFFETPYEVEQPKWRSPKASTMQDDGKIMVSVVSSKPGEKFSGEPFLLALTAEEASDWRTIERKICERLEALRGVGSRIWAKGAEIAEAGGQGKSAETSAAAKRIVADEEELEAMDPSEQPPSNTTKTSQRLINNDIATILLSKSDRGDKPFTRDHLSPLYSLEDRFNEARVSQEADNGEPAMPGAFGPDGNENLYPATDAEMTNEQPMSETKSTSCKRPILTVGETLLVQWEPGFAQEAFGRELFRNRPDSRETMSRQERITAPSILARKRGNGKGGGKENITVEQLLDEFVKEEKLSEDNMWYCPSCKKHQQAQKKFDLWKMPDVLVIHLKRFSNERAFRDKIDTMIDFPIEGLDLSNRVEGKRTAERLAEAGAPASLSVPSNGEESLVYDLYAVDNHFGGLGGGHYTAHAKNVNDGKWYYFDDSRVSSEMPDRAKTSAAYLLFYIRRTEKIGGKTHDILASQAPTPSMSKEGSPDHTDGQPFRDGGSSVGAQSSSLYQEPNGQYSRGSQGHGYGFSGTSRFEDTMTNYDDDDEMFPGARSYGGSPAVSESGLPGYDSSPFPNGPFTSHHRGETTEWEFSAPTTTEQKAESPVAEVHIDPQYIAEAAADADMEGADGGMNELE